MEYDKWLLLYVPRDWQVADASNLHFVDVSKRDGSGLVIAVFTRAYFQHTLKDWHEEVISSTIPSHECIPPIDVDSDISEVMEEGMADVHSDDGDSDYDDAPSPATPGATSEYSDEELTQPVAPPQFRPPVGGGKNLHHPHTGGKSLPPRPTGKSPRPTPSPPPLPATQKRSRPQEMDDAATASAPSPKVPRTTIRSSLAISAEYPRSAPIMALAAKVERALWKRPFPMAAERSRSTEPPVRAVKTRLKHLCPHLTYYDYASVVMTLHGVIQAKLNAECGIDESDDSSNDISDHSPDCYLPRSHEISPQMERRAAYASQWLRENKMDYVTARKFMHRVLVMALHVGYPDMAELPPAHLVMTAVRLRMASSMGLCAACGTGRAMPPDEDKCVECILTQKANETN